MIYYTGIGSRETPQEIQSHMCEIGFYLSKDMTLRSGGADGADTAFEMGVAARIPDVKSEIYLPWKGFNKNSLQRERLPQSELYLDNLPKDKVAEAMEIAASIHPVWRQLTHGAKLLHTRNVFQVLGKNLNEPSEVLICWTMGGGERGGTATAMKLAKKHDVPVFNLYNTLDGVALNEWTKLQ